LVVPSLQKEIGQQWGVLLVLLLASYEHAPSCPRASQVSIYQIEVQREPVRMILLWYVSHERQ
jgi:hypothetical protein